MSIHYRFKSNIDFTTIPCEGRTLRLLDLKYAIVEMNKLDKGMDFDLIVTNADTNETYRDDKFHVPRNTRVIVKRAPAGPNGGIIQQMNLLKMKDQKDTMVRHGVLGSALPTNATMSLGSEFSSKNDSDDKAGNSGVATKKEEKYDPRMMDSSDEEDDDDGNDDTNVNDKEAADNIDEENGDDDEAKLLAELEKQQEEEAAQIKSLAQTAENTRQMEIRVSNSVKSSIRGRRRGPWRAHVRDHSDLKKKEGGDGDKVDSGDVADGGGTEGTPSAPIWGGLATTKKDNDSNEQNQSNDGGDDVNATKSSIPKQFQCPITKKVLVDAVNLPCCGATVSKVAAKEKLKKLNNNLVKFIKLMQVQIC